MAEVDSMELADVRADCLAQVRLKGLTYVLD